MMEMDDKTMVSKLVTGFGITLSIVDGKPVLEAAFLEVEITPEERVYMEKLLGKGRAHG
jgi:hypothetical protein